ncbi:DapH/DapD/GlmU-related protein [Ectothiorhodospira lacustris]|uniref:DapH/DapD/GlmU-related protein n=1 Tax=Ectothiorhodospira lacustris TaxID=2899127 RepID=UPI001EE7A3A1|nr:DapH/DapD/GlmU-related protein [Ectothiorhodospira lacustris]MCG5510851.1 acyltransferase [Ectothiorhodospira lacustris]MCG5522603.1 acyltransferase [Ectothiorhodospira lacustris]
MRPITIKQIAVFLVLFGLAVCLGSLTVWMMLGSMPLGDFRGVILIISGVVFIYLWSFLIYRIFLWRVPLGVGKILPGSREEFSAQVNILFYLVLFNSLIRTHFIPVPVMRLVYQALGTRMGKNSYSAGVILDPPLTEIGSDTIIGHGAVLFSHAIEGDRFELASIRLGNNVTIGATAVIMSGVNVGDRAIVSAGSVVLKHTQIGPGEIWGGVPARRLR